MLKAANAMEQEETTSADNAKLYGLDESGLLYVELQDQIDEISRHQYAVFKSNEMDLNKKASELKSVLGDSAKIPPSTCFYEDIFNKIKSLRPDLSDEDVKILTDEVFVVLNFHNSVLSFALDIAHDFRTLHFYDDMVEISFKEYEKQLGTRAALLKEIQGSLGLQLYSQPTSANQHALEKRTTEIRLNLHEFVQRKYGIAISEPLSSTVSYGDDDDEDDEDDEDEKMAQDNTDDTEILDEIIELLGTGEIDFGVDTCKERIRSQMQKKNGSGKNLRFVDMGGSIADIDGASFKIPDDLRSSAKVEKEYIHNLGPFFFRKGDSGIVLSLKTQTGEFLDIKKLPPGASVTTLINLMNKKLKQMENQFEFPKQATRSGTAKVYAETILKTTDSRIDLCSTLSVKAAGDDIVRQAVVDLNQEPFFARILKGPTKLGITLSGKKTIMITGDNLLADRTARFDNCGVLLTKPNKKVVITVPSFWQADPMQKMILRFYELAEILSSNIILELYDNIQATSFAISQYSYSGHLCAELLSTLIEYEFENYKNVREFIDYLKSLIERKNYAEFLKQINKIGAYTLEPGNSLLQFLYGQDKEGKVYVLRTIDGAEEIILANIKKDRQQKITLNDFFMIPDSNPPQYVVGVRKTETPEFLIQGSMDWITGEAFEDEYKRWEENLRTNSKKEDGGDELDMIGLSVGWKVTKSKSEYGDEILDPEILKDALNVTTLLSYLNEVMVLEGSLLIPRGAYKNKRAPTLSEAEISKFKKFNRYMFYSLSQLVADVMFTRENNKYDEEDALDEDHADDDMGGEDEGEDVDEDVDEDEDLDEEEEFYEVEDTLTDAHIVASETAKVYIDFIYSLYKNNPETYDFDKLKNLLLIIMEDDELPLVQFETDESDLLITRRMMRNALKNVLSLFSPKNLGSISRYWDLNRGLFNLSRVGPLDSDYISIISERVVRNNTWTDEMSDNGSVYTQSTTGTTATNRSWVPLIIRKASSMLEPIEEGDDEDLSLSEIGEGEFDYDSDEDGEGGDVYTAPGTVDRNQKRKLTDLSEIEKGEESDSGNSNKMRVIDKGGSKKQTLKYVEKTNKKTKRRKQKKQTKKSKRTKSKKTRKYKRKSIS